MTKKAAHAHALRPGTLARVQMHAEHIKFDMNLPGFDCLSEDFVETCAHEDGDLIIVIQTRLDKFGRSFSLVTGKGGIGWSASKFLVPSNDEAEEDDEP